MLRPTLFILRLVLCTCFAAGAFGADRKERDKAPLPKPPPQPVEQSVKVRRGETITIPLKIWGTQREPLQFLIRKPPMAGKLSEPKQNGKEAAVVEYESPASLEVKKDLFTYAVRNSLGVSAAVEVAIEIVDEPPMLGFPDAVTFPPILAGQSAMKEIEIENRGGGMAEGELSIDTPWKIEGPADYQLGAGERKTVMIIFSPEKGGSPRGEIRFSSDKTRTIALRAEALAAIAVEPATVRMQAAPGNPVRIGVFALTNNTEGVQKVQFAPNAKLKVEPEVEIASHGTVQITISTTPEAVGALEETLEGRAGDAVVRIAVSAPPSDPVLRAVSGDIRFTDAARESSVTVQNAGGKPGFWKWEVEAPFVPAETGFQLAPGERKELRLRLAEGATGNSRTLLRLVGEGHTVQIAAEVHLMEPAATSAQPVPRSTARRPQKSVRVRNVSLEREKGPLVPSRVPNDVKVDEVGSNRIVISWTAKPEVEYRVEERSFVFKADGGEIEARWQPVNGVAMSRAEDRSVAELKNLKPGHLYVLRVVDSGNAASATPALQVATLSPGDSPLITKRRLILLGLFIVLGTLIWQRRRHG